jgi:hypothetical protein
LARLEPALGLVDHIDPALAADEAVIAMATAQGLQRITDFHGLKPSRAAVTRAIMLLEFGPEHIDRPARRQFRRHNSFEHIACPENSKKQRNFNGIWSLATSPHMI